MDKLIIAKRILRFNLNTTYIDYQDSIYVPNCKKIK